MNKTTYFEGPQELSLGHSAFRLGKYKEALVEYEKAVSKDHEFALLFLAQTLLKLGNVSESNFAYVKGFQRHNNVFPEDKLKAIPQGNENIPFNLEQFLNLINSPSAYYTIGHISNRMGQFQLAEKYLHKALILDPQRSSIRVELALVLFEKDNDVGKSIQHLVEAKKLDPKNFEAQIELGEMFVRAEQAQKAFECFEEAEKLNSNSSKLYLCWGHAFRKLDRLDSAAQRYQRAVEIDPNNYEAYYGSGVVLEILGQKERAYKEYEKALAKNPFYWEGYERCGKISYSLRMWADVVNCAEKVEELNPKSESLKNIWNESLKKLGYRKEAEKMGASHYDRFECRTVDMKEGQENEKLGFMTGDV